MLIWIVNSILKLLNKNMKNKKYIKFFLKKKKKKKKKKLINY